MLAGMYNSKADNSGNSGGTSYKEYLRSQFIYKEFRDLNLRSFPALVSCKVTLIV